MRICVFGASGGIGSALLDHYERNERVRRIYAGARRCGAATDRTEWFPFDLEDEDSIAAAAARVARDGPVNLVLVATGMLSGAEMSPEKSWSAQNGENYARAFAVNAIGPALIGKHFLPLLDTSERSVFAVLSARVGSVTDNRLGGWHAYRASKAALNMILRNFAIELTRRNEQAIAVSLHPGTVLTPLSQPFVSLTSPALQTPAQAARHLAGVIDRLESEHNGKLIAWDGQEIPF